MTGGGFKLTGTRHIMSGVMRHVLGCHDRGLSVNVASWHGHCSRVVQVGGEIVDMYRVSLLAVTHAGKGNRNGWMGLGRLLKAGYKGSRVGREDMSTRGGRIGA